MHATTKRLLAKDLNSTSLNELFRCIVEECKNYKDVPTAERVFNRLLLKLELTDVSRRPADLHNPNRVSRERPFSEEEIEMFRKAIATIIRYAGSPWRARKYAVFFLTQIGQPLRDAHTENTCLINIIYVYSHSGNREQLVEGVDFVKIGMERGIVLNTKSAYEQHDSFDNGSSVFSSVSLNILRHNNLYPTADGLHLQDRYGRRV